MIGKLNVKLAKIFSIIKATAVTENFNPSCGQKANRNGAAYGHYLQTGKTTVIRRKGVGDTCVSRHQENVIEGLSETPQTITQCSIEGFKENPQLGPPFNRETSVFLDRG